jgi:hypothetical protein
MLKIRVIAPYIMLKVKDPATGGVAVREFYKGAILPDGADSDDVKRLTGKNMLAEEQLADPEPEQAPEPTLVASGDAGPARQREQGRMGRLRGVPACRRCVRGSRQGRG